MTQLEANDAEGRQMNTIKAKPGTGLLALVLSMVPLLLSCRSVTTPGQSSVTPARQSASRDVLLRAQTETFDRLVSYCRFLDPKTSSELAVEYEAYKRKLAVAYAPLLAKMPVEITPKEAADLNSFITETGDLTLEAIKKFEPSSYCPWLRKKMRSTTTEELASTAQAQYDRYTELAERKSPPTPGVGVK